MPTNFHLAPPPKTVNGLLAVPMDIQHLVASLRFDAAAETCDVDATIEFVVAPTSGNPIFDLRQTIGAAWLDGAPFDMAQLAHHDFGGGTDADLRVIESVLAAGSTHTLRVTYQLALPNALNSSSGPPTFQWNAGRLTLKFWYTDLRAGRYLDAWLPGNLLFDQFSADLDIELVNTGIAHILITNGTRTDLGPNHWQVQFPAHFTVCSGMLRIHPEEEIESRVGSVALPSGSTVEIRTYKPTGSTTNLAAQETLIGSMLSSDETEVGPYAHGSRFTVFFEGSGGMEYAGACRTDLGLLRHETFHSWWGRGVQPATQNDGWWDEAWTVYVTGGYGPAPLSYANPPVELYSQNPWVRRTTGLSYSNGRDFFRGVASFLGDTSLRNLMSQFYQERLNDLATTLELESFLLSASGETTLVDAFHRFVYGFDDPEAAPNLWMRDDPAHLGAELWEDRFWDSPDLWVRPRDDGVVEHQNPVEDQDNWLYARVRNQGGTARHFMVTFNVKQFAGTEFVYPYDFLPCIAATGGFELGPGESRVVKTLWPATLVPPAGTHGCLLGAVLARSDHPVGGRHVWEDNNLAQKNLTMAELDSDGWVVIPVVVGSRFTTARSVVLELMRPQGFEHMQASVLYPVGPKYSAAVEERIDCGGEDRPSVRAAPLGIWTDKSGAVWAKRYFSKPQEKRLEPGKAVQWTVSSKAGFPIVIGLRLVVPEDAEPGRSLTVDLVQRDEKNRIVGGIAAQINIRQKHSKHSPEGYTKSQTLSMTF